VNDLFFITPSNSPAAMTYGTQRSRGLFWIVIDNWELGDKLPLWAEVGPNHVISDSSGSQTPTPITNLDMESSASIAVFWHCIVFLKNIFFRILNYAQSKPSVLMK